MTAVAPRQIRPARTHKGGRVPVAAAKAADALRGSFLRGKVASETRPARSGLLLEHCRPTYGGALSRRDLALLDQGAQGPGTARTGIDRLLNSTPELTEVPGSGVEQETECRT